MIDVISTLVVEIVLSETLETPIRIKGLPLDAVQTRAVTRQEEEEKAAQTSSSSPALPTLAGCTHLVHMAFTRVRAQLDSSSLD